MMEVWVLFCVPVTAVFRRVGWWIADDGGLGGAHELPNFCLRRRFESVAEKGGLDLVFGVCNCRLRRASSWVAEYGVLDGFGGLPNFLFRRSSDLSPKKEDGRVSGAVASVFGDAFIFGAPKNSINRK